MTIIDHGGKLKPILSGSDAVFKQAKHKFIDQFEDHLKASVTNLYAPEQIMSRNKMIGVSSLRVWRILVGTKRWTAC